MAMPYSPSKCRVLIVDDDADTALTTALLFEMEGHATRTALSGIKALDQGAEFRPHLILLDIAMPEMDGFAVARAMRETEWGKSAVLVAVTGYGTPSIKQRCAVCGFDQHLLKPVNYGEFIDVLTESGNAMRGRSPLGRWPSLQAEASPALKCGTHK